MDQPKIERVLRLMMLLTGNSHLSVEQLAEHLHTSKRSVYRYLDTFKEAGFVVRKEGDAYRLGKESKYFKDISQLVHFTEEEAYIIHQLIENLDNTNLLKQNLRRKLASVYSCTSMANCIVKGQNASNVRGLVEAIENRKQALLVDYASSHTAQVRDRTVEPFAFTTNYIQVWCFEPETRQNKLFSLSRIGQVRVLEKDQAYTGEHKQGYTDIFRMSSHRQFPVKVELGLLAHNLILEEYPLAERDLRPIGENRWLLETRVCSFAGITRFLTGVAEDIRIRESSQLKAYIRDYVSRNLADL